MNRKQREQNRKNANRLRLNAHVCENCGERGGHWVQTAPQSLAMAIMGLPDDGFWICAKYYGPDGKRLPEGPNAEFTERREASAGMTGYASN